MPSVKLDSHSITVPKILCIGRNYIEHAKEMKADVPTTPVFFLKPPTALIPTGGVIHIPDISKELHHEVELTVLIGKGGSAIAESSALSHVAGYGVGLDMTLRDIQAEAKKKGLPWTLAKGFDTSAPVSLFIPANSVPAVPSLTIELNVNDNVRQKGNLGDLIFPVERVIAYLSRYITLEAGDVIFTGTPEGVAEAKPGDTLYAELQDASGRALTSLRVSVA